MKLGKGGADRPIRRAWGRKGRGPGEKGGRSVRKRRPPAGFTAVVAGMCGFAWHVSAQGPALS
eukprot:scaffold25399_cov24-Tisochrysis_lutea.AAC.1